MKYLKYYILFILFALSAFTVNAQEQKGTFNLHIQVKDKQTKEPLEFALVYLTDGNRHRDAICDEDGKTSIDNLQTGNYKLTISYIGYKKWEEELNINSNKTFEILLTSNSNELNEVVVTASESRGMTSSSIIDRKAMQHLQPSSFTDLLELLPGGISQDPKLSSANLIKIREVGISSERYDISSLGTSFVVDGAPISTDANMQYLPSGNTTIIGSSGNTDSKRSTVNRGVDMRSISTDEIEKVEVVRGIPSVQYGDLTSGLVRIERRKGATPWTARLKVDGYSKLFAGNKGFDFKKKNLFLNFGIDFLDSKHSPTNSFEGYQRLTYSVRTEKQWKKNTFDLKWHSGFDHAHTFDKVKVDPNIYDNIQPSAELEYLKKDKYRSKYDRLSFTNNFNLKPKNIPFISSIDLNTSVAYELNKIEQTKFVQLNSLAITIPISREAGNHDGIFLPNKFLSDTEIDGKPLSVFIKGLANLKFSTSNINHKSVIGGEWTFDKNYGDGEVYDPKRPLSENYNSRPRKFSDIPAKQNLNFFVEDEMALPVGKNIFKLNAGLRGMSMVNMDSRYKMNGKLYFDPRINSEWNFPAFKVKGKDMNISIAGGIGWHTKFPTLNQIYPDYTYRDFVQLNYYNVSDPQYSRVNYQTYKTLTINYGLEPARNRKWEVRLNLQYDNNTLSVSYFREKMTDGFRTQVMNFEYTPFKRYSSNKDSLVIDPETNLPNLEKSKYEVKERLRANSATGNGTRIDKEGIEFTLSTKRLEYLKTRLTISGAWFKTKYLNSCDMYGGTSQYINGEPIQEIGIFDSSGGDYRETFNTRFMFDTYIPSLGFEFSSTFQCEWFYIQQEMAVTRYPYAYIDVYGNQQPYTEADKSDTKLKFLTCESNPGKFEKKRIPFGMAVNLKASKKIKDIMQLSLFVNRLLDYYPDYKINGAVIKRSYTPYFGMEITFTL